MTKKITIGMFGIMLVFSMLTLGCGSGPKEAPLEPQREGAKSILEWVKADGVYGIAGDEEGGGLTFQFMGETWIQMLGDTPVVAGSMTGMPAKPGTVSDDDPFDPEQWRAFYDTLGTTEGDINLTVTMVYFAGRWQSMESFESALNNPIASRTIPQSLQDSFSEFQEGITLSYRLTAEAPFITLTKK